MCIKYRYLSLFPSWFLWWCPMNWFDKGVHGFSHPVTTKVVISELQLSFKTLTRLRDALSQLLHLICSRRVEYIGKDDPNNHLQSWNWNNAIMHVQHDLHIGFSLASCPGWISLTIGFDFHFYQLYNPTIPCYLDEYPTHIYTVCPWLDHFCL